ncbi:MAG TPA: hypothetical protein VG603_07310 [Chitinophagales bacterium]|nr:hypothetical protein [Chitinophagales bacterium]
MKKQCSKCGFELDLGKRSCTHCGAFNPFYIANYKPVSTISNDFTGLELETPSENPEPETGIAEKRQQQANETFRQIKEVRDKAEQEREQYDKERMRAEHEQLEQQLKHEIGLVKEETELYQKQTIGIVKEIHDELKQVSEENKKLKQEIESLSKVAVVPEIPAPQPVEHHTVHRENKFLLVTLVLVALLGLGLASFYFFVVSNNTTPAAPTTIVTAPAASSAVATNTPPVNTATSVAGTAPAVPTANSSTASTTSAKVPASLATQLVETAKPSSTVLITAYKIKHDLVGKKITGCGITIGSMNEITGVDNLVLVEKLAGGDAKYKCFVHIKQGADTYSAMPYIYYNASGGFIRVDGANCEQ